MLMNGAAVNVLDRWGGTPFNDALRAGHKDVAQFLKTNGASSKISKTQLLKKYDHLIESFPDMMAEP